MCLHLTPVAAGSTHTWCYPPQTIVLPNRLGLCERCRQRVHDLREPFSNFFMRSSIRSTNSFPMVLIPRAKCRRDCSGKRERACADRLRHLFLHDPQGVHQERQGQFRNLPVEKAQEYFARRGHQKRYVARGTLCTLIEKVPQRQHQEFLDLQKVNRRTKRLQRTVSD